MTHCKNPKCHLEVTPNQSGRPKEYCNKRCRDAAYRMRNALDTPETGPEDGYTAAVAADITGHARLIEAQAARPGPDATRELLRLLPAAQLSMGDLEAAVVRRARLEGVPTTEIARALGMSPQRLRKRWPRGAMERRMLRRERRRPFTTTLSQNLRGEDRAATTPADVLG
ncbi:hypothetical protein MTQ13_06645 [Streptomyces sp. XM4011]|uniref:hypothetical protein n=1 Tax=Streptomyces sp. XM4011 TaxID=2929780 RepID=UPI001FFA41A7|nr:hypothetical protein [Streptomyces sp. XM4011]MCK1813955.1 hypothetical protein [Streptomyces sp. XM4011]